MKNLKIGLVLVLTILSIDFVQIYAQETKDNVIHILAIGNSFSEDAVENYLYDLAKAEGYNVVIANLYKGGCNLETHLENANGDIDAYEYRKISVDGIHRNTKNKSIEDVLADENWDYISFQQASPLSGLFDTYEVSLPDLIKYVKSKNSNPATIYMLHQTWAYAKSSNHSGFKNYRKSQKQMYKAIVDAVWKAADLVDINLVIPAGTAIQNGRRTNFGDNFCRDGYHLDYNIGRFTAACTWFEKIFNVNVINNPYKPDKITYTQAETIKRAAHYAILNPRTVTRL